MNTLRVGDRVQFHLKPPHGRPALGFASGTITELHVWGGVEYARVTSDSWVVPKLIDVREVTPLSTEAIMRAVRAMVTDDVERESAISACRIRDIVDDYPAAMALGSMSAAELV